MDAVKDQLSHSMEITLKNDTSKMEIPTKPKYENKLTQQSKG